MMRKIGMLLFGALSVSASAGDYYRWVDENGTLHFSDSPPSVGLELEVELSTIPLPSQGSSIVASPTSPEAPPAPGAPETPPLASSISLLTPDDEATVRSNEGNITLNISTDLPLGRNQSIRAVVDGKKQPASKGASLTLTNVDRGTHTIKVQLLQDGKVIAASHSVTVYLHRATKKKVLPPGKPTPR
ncbi:DUF4124 domain-containing protein [Grimontia sp. NTOU-MAR1]|uniref:DUF4124 domain-containing protein n=1 Tax=Grimontia sp. NTOU-MAR1 TaxID=3111011 RepID=UPI002DB88462|nr:DUF4124 domain-containing protein [Grimontia sp. NTOU-MAR1]WRV96595.1 DUF4124 domain-containing protein [Grimontia sp. NTOU-MAR1]